MEHEHAVGAVVGDSGTREVDDSVFTLRNAAGEVIYSRVFRDMPSPTEEQLASPLFNAIWRAIKSWDINVPECYELYCGANGSHVMLIMNEINKLEDER